MFPMLRASLSSAFALVPCLAVAGEMASAEIVTNAALGDVRYERYWQGHVSLRHGDEVKSAELLDENLYLRTYGGALYAVQADTGLLRWAERIPDRSAHERRPTHVQTDVGDGPLVLVTKSQLFVLDRYSGEQLRRIDLPFASSSGAVADATGIYLGGMDGTFYALRWVEPVARAPLVRWRVGVAGRVMTTPSLTFDNRLYFVSDEGVVYCVRTRDKALIWAYRTYASVSAGLHVDESGVYVATVDNRLYVLDRDHGRRIRRYLLPAPLFDAPVVVRRTLYQHCAGVGMFAFDVDSREQLWEVRGAEKFVARSNDRVVLTDADGDLAFVDDRTGEAEDRLALPAGVFAVENRRGGVLYLVTVDGRMLCAKPAGFPYLRREQVAAARSTLHRSPFSEQEREGVEEELTSEKEGVSERRIQDPLRSGGGG
jgi:outer membrane protein assembly factor BamB